MKIEETEQQKKIKDLQKWRSKWDLQHEWQQSKKGKWCTFAAQSNPNVSFFGNTSICRDLTLLGLSHSLLALIFNQNGKFWWFFVQKSSSQQRETKERQIILVTLLPKDAKIFFVNAYLLLSIFELNLFFKV